MTIINWFSVEIFNSTQFNSFWSIESIFRRFQNIQVRPTRTHLFFHRIAHRCMIIIMSILIVGNCAFCCPATVVDIDFVWTNCEQWAFVWNVCNDFSRRGEKWIYRIFDYITVERDSCWAGIATRKIAKFSRPSCDGVFSMNYCLLGFWSRDDLLRARCTRFGMVFLAKTNAIKNTNGCCWGCKMECGSVGDNRETAGATY